MAEGGRLFQWNKDYLDFGEKIVAGHAIDEVEYCTGSTKTLWNSLRKCKKNPGHSMFMLLSEFGKLSLPPECRDQRLVSFIKHASRFTVRVLVRLVSVERPDHLQCGRLRGEKTLRLASGYAWLPREIQELPCPIPKCSHSKRPHAVYGYIRVITAQHAVYDQVEALRTQVEFDFDFPGKHRPTSVVDCIGVDHSCNDTDRVHLNCVSHDREFCLKLQIDMDLLDKAYCAIPLHVLQNCQGLCVVISHPHGMAKAISIGRHLSFEITEAQSHAHYFLTPTCPGSSGAPVYYVSPGEKGALPFRIPAIHSHYCTFKQQNCAYK